MHFIIFAFQIVLTSQVKEGMTAPTPRLDSITKSTPDLNKSGTFVTPNLKVSAVPEFAQFPVEDNFW